MVADQQLRAIDHRCRYMQVPCCVPLFHVDAEEDHGSGGYRSCERPEGQSQLWIHLTRQDIVGGSFVLRRSSQYLPVDVRQTDDGRQEENEGDQRHCPGEDSPPPEIFHPLALCDPNVDVAARSCEDLVDFLSRDSGRGKAREEVAVTLERRRMEQVRARCLVESAMEEGGVRWTVLVIATAFAAAHRNDGVPFLFLDH